MKKHIQFNDLEPGKEFYLESSKRSYGGIKIRQTTAVGRKGGAPTLMNAVILWTHGKVDAPDAGQLTFIDPNETVIVQTEAEVADLTLLQFIDSLHIGSTSPMREEVFLAFGHTSESASNAELIMLFPRSLITLDWLGSMVAQYLLQSGYTSTNIRKLTLGADSPAIGFEAYAGFTHGMLLVGNDDALGSVSVMLAQNPEMISIIKQSSQD